MSDQPRFTAGVKLGKPILVNGIMFTSKGGQKYAMYYRCHNNACPCRCCVTFNEDKIITGIKYIHNEHTCHMNMSFEEIQRIERELFNKPEEMLELKKKLATNVTSTTRQLIQGTKYATMDSHALATIKCRAMKEFELPNSVDKINATHFLLASYKDTVFIYGQPSGLFIMSQSKVIFEDGTFKIVSNNHQLLILHGFINGKCVACCFIRVMSKSFQDYAAALQLVETLAKSMELSILKRSDIEMKGDFEKAMISAVRIITTAKFSGCLFHYCQAIMKHIRKNSLLDYYHEGSEFYRVVRRLSMLAVIPIEYSNYKTFCLLVELFKQQCPELSRNQNVINFFEYVDQTWFTYSRNSFPPTLWNVNDTDIRTNNLCESSHKRLNFDCTHKRSVYQTFKLIDIHMKEDYARVTDPKTNETFDTLMNQINSSIHFCLQCMNNTTGPRMFFVDALDYISNIIQMDNLDSLRKYCENEMTFAQLNEKIRHYDRIHCTNDQYKTPTIFNDYVPTDKVIKEAKQVQDDIDKGVNTFIRTFDNATKELAQKVKRNEFTVADIYSCDKPLDFLNGTIDLN